MFTPIRNLVEIMIGFIIYSNICTCLMNMCQLFIQRIVFVAINIGFIFDFSGNVFNDVPTLVEMNESIKFILN